MSYTRRILPPVPAAVESVGKLNLNELDTGDALVALDAFLGAAIGADLSTREGVLPTLSPRQIIAAEMAAMKEERSAADAESADDTVISFRDATSQLQQRTARTASSPNSNTTGTVFSFPPRQAL